MPEGENIVDYPYNLEDIRKVEFLNLKDALYLDHTGSTVYSTQQIQNYTTDLQSTIYGNPHSGSPSSQMTTAIIHQIRCKVLAWFNVTPDEYDVIFCSGCTGGLKLLCSCLSWTPGSKYAYLEDNHTSVVGMRETALDHGAKCYCLSYPQSETASSKKSIFNLHDYDIHQVACPTVRASDSDGKFVNLFAFPAQSNFSGCKYPLNWIKEVQSNKLTQFSDSPSSNDKLSPTWLVLLDAAAFVPTSPLDLKAYGADFVCLSFYKMFGFPTGIGALLVKKESEKYLSDKRYFGGGTANGYLATTNYYKPRSILHERLEDGSLPFLDIIALKHGFDTVNRICRSMERIQNHTFSLIRRMYEGMQRLRHSNKQPAVKMYSHSEFQSSASQGPIISFNLIRKDGSFVGFNHVMHLAASYNIHLRTGCFCNVGACSSLLKLDAEKLKSVYESGHTCGDHIDLVDGQPVGAIRVSLGYMSTDSDVDKFLAFLRECFVSPTFEGSDDIFYDSVSDLPSKKKPDVLLETIFLYPVKSCHGLEVKKWELSETGLKYDRNWMIVNEHGVCLTLKREARLTLIHPSINLKEATLTLRADGVGNVTLPLDAGSSNGELSESSVCQTKVCGDRIVGSDCGAEVSHWLSNLLGYDVYLLRKVPDARRISKRFDLPIRKNGSNHVNDHPLALTNEAQFLMISRNSAEHLHRAMVDADLNVDDVIGRFRCNFVVGGAEPFAEESWESISVKSKSDEHDVNLVCVGLCNRCSMVCIDHKNGTRTCEPLRTLGSLPTSEYARSPSTRRKNFGVYLCSLNCSVFVKVGDCVNFKTKS